MKLKVLLTKCKNSPEHAIIPKTTQKQRIYIYIYSFGQTIFKQIPIHQTSKHADFIEMLKWFSLCPCRSIMQLQDISMSLGIEITQLVEMQKPLSLAPSRTKTDGP